VLQHVDDIIAAKPAAVWLQSGIRNAQAEEMFAKAGMKVRHHSVCSPALLLHTLWQATHLLIEMSGRE